MDDKQAMHAMSIDDAYHVEHTLARGPSGVTELVSIDGNGPFVRKKIPSPLAQRNVWAALSACQSNRLPRVEATYELPDRFVIVYDYVPGSTLAQIAEENGRLAPNVAVQLIDQICEAVQELHQHGVIHRDITPANVIVAQDGAHLIDFGIARIRSEASNRSRDTTALGTYGFASPEQYGFAKTDARSDVFSLGRLLGFMLTGVYPDASDYEQRLADDAAVPARLRAVIGYACAFEPSKRPQSVQEFRQALFSQSNPPIPNASSANPPSTRTTNGSASASRLFRRLHLSKRAIVLWSIAGAALIIAARIIGAASCIRTLPAVQPKNMTAIFFILLISIFILLSIRKGLPEHISSWQPSITCYSLCWLVKWIVRILHAFRHIAKPVTSPSCAGSATR